MLRWLNSLPSTTEPHPGDGVPAIQDNWYQVSFFRPDPKLSYADALNRNRRGHHGANPSPVKPVDWVPRVLQTQAIATDEAAEALRVAESSRAYQVPEPSDETTSNFSFRSGWASGCPSSGWGSRRYGRWLDSLRAHELAAESCYGVYPELGLEVCSPPMCLLLASPKLYTQRQRRHDYDFDTRRDVYGHLFAGRDPDNHLRDFRSVSKAQQRIRAHKHRYPGYTAVSTRETAALHHLILDHQMYWPDMYRTLTEKPKPKWTLWPEDRTVTETRPVSKRTLWLHSRIHCSSLYYGGHQVPGMPHFRWPKCLGCIKRKAKRMYRHREMEFARHEGSDPNLQYLASGGDLSRFYGSPDVQLKRLVLNEDLTSSRQHFERREDVWQHGLQECDARPGETCLHIITLEREAFVVVGHVEIDGERRRVCREGRDDWELWPPATLRPEDPGTVTVSLADYLGLTSATDTEDGASMESKDWSVYDMSSSGRDWEQCGGSMGSSYCRDYMSSTESSDWEMA